MACFFHRESLLDVYDHLTLRFNENPGKSRYALREPNKTTIREGSVDISFKQHPIVKITIFLLKISNYPPLMAARIKARPSSTQLNDLFRTHKISHLSRWVKDHCPLFLFRERSSSIVGNKICRSLGALNCIRKKQRGQVPLASWRSHHLCASDSNVSRSSSDGTFTSRRPFQKPFTRIPCRFLFISLRLLHPRPAARATK